MDSIQLLPVRSIRCLIFRLVCKNTWCSVTWNGRWNSPMKSSWSLTWGCLGMVLFPRIGFPTVLCPRGGKNDWPTMERLLLNYEQWFWGLLSDREKKNMKNKNISLAFWYPGISRFFFIISVQLFYYYYICTTSFGRPAFLIIFNIPSTSESWWYEKTWLNFLIWIFVNLFALCILI